MQSHSRSRGWALQALYAWETRGAEPEDLVRILAELAEEMRVSPQNRLFADVLLRIVARELPRLNATIQRHLTNWRIERLSVIDRNILRLGAAELLYLDGVPGRHTVREMVRLAEKYSTPESPRFIKGVLDAILRATAADKAGETG